MEGEGHSGFRSQEVQSMVTGEASRVAWSMLAGACTSHMCQLTRNHRTELSRAKTTTLRCGLRDQALTSRPHSFLPAKDQVFKHMNPWGNLSYSDHDGNVDNSGLSFEVLLVCHFWETIQENFCNFSKENLCPAIWWQEVPKRSNTRKTLCFSLHFKTFFLNLLR